MTTATLNLPAAEHSETKPARVLDRVAYDTIKAGAERHGGVGYGVNFSNEDGSLWIGPKHTRGKPVDPIGLLMEADWTHGEAFNVLHAAGLMSHEASIDAPLRLIHELGIPFGPDGPYPRFPFGAWCRALNIVRGPK